MSARRRGRWIKCSGLQLHWAECGPPRWELIGRRVCRRLSTVQIALNIADVSAPAAGQQPVRRMAARAPASLVAVASQPEMDTQVGDMEGPQVAGSSVRTAVLDNLWLADLRCSNTRPEGRPGWFQCLLIQGRCPAEYLALLPSHTARVITSASSARWICNRIRKWALSVRTCIRACTVVVHKAIPWLPLCTGCSVPPWRRTLPSS
jgi:hypothetical protein